MNKAVDGLISDVDHEKKKNGKIIKENQELRKELEAIHELVTGSNDPKSLKTKLNEKSAKLLEANKINRDRNKMIKHL